MYRFRRSWVTHYLMYIQYMVHRVKIPKEMMESKFSGNMHIYTLCNKYLQRFSKLGYKMFITLCIFNIWPKILSSKNPNLTLCPKSLQSFTKLLAAM